MKSRKRECRHIAHSNPRAGMLAVSELLLMLVVVTALIWASVQFMSVVTSISTSTPTLSASCSERCVTRLALTEDGHRMWVYRLRLGVARLNLQNGNVEQSIPLMGMDLAALAHDREGSTTITCDVDGTVALFRDSEVTQAAHLKKNDVIIDASVSHDGSVAACVTSCGLVFGWKFDGTEVSEFQFQLPVHFNVTRLTLSRDGQRMFLASRDGFATILDSETGMHISHCLNFGEICTRFVWSDDERLVAIMTTSGLVRVYDIVASRIVCEVGTGSSTWQSNSRTLQISPDGRRVAIATEKSTEISILDVETGKICGTLCGHLGMVSTLQFASTSDRLFSGSYDGTIREWSLQTYSQLRVIN